jgi:hypothetical protein
MSKRNQQTEVKLKSKNRGQTKIITCCNSRIIPLEFEHAGDYTLADIERSGFILSNYNSFIFTPHGTGHKETTTGHAHGNQSISAVAVGQSFFAVSTYSNTVQVYSASGLPLHVFSFPDQITVLKAAASNLFIVFGYSQTYQLIDVDAGKTIVEGKLNTRGAVNWATLDAETGTPYVMVGGELLLEHSEMGWVPVLKLDRVVDRQTQWLIPVKVSKSVLHCSVSFIEEYPASDPLPELDQITLAPLTTDPTGESVFSAFLSMQRSVDVSLRSRITTPSSYVFL